MFLSLSDLPTEIILIILNQLPTSTLFNVGELCSRLNFLAMPLYLERIGIPKPSELCLIKSRHNRHKNQLSGLILNFGLAHIDRLVCNVDNKRDQDLFVDIRCLMQDIQRIHQFVSRLSSIGSACIVSHYLGEKWSLRSEVVRNFIATFLGLLETLIQKSCKSLQVIHSHPIAIETGYSFQLVDDLPVVRTPFVESIKQHVSSLRHRHRLSTDRVEDPELHGDGWRYRQAIVHEPISPLSSGNTHQSILTNFDIASDLLLLPPFSTWTFSTLRKSPITTLTLSLPRQVTKEEFHHYTFPKIAHAVPNLEEIKLAFCRDEFMRTVVENLSLLPTLRKVTFGLTVIGLLPEINHELEITLPHLLSFTGSPAQAAYFFGHNIHCPNFRTINIVADGYFLARHEESGTFVGNDLTKLATRLSERNISPRVSLCLYNDGGLPTPRTEHTLSSDIPDWTYGFDRIACLTLETPPSFPYWQTSSMQAAYALAWLDVFRGVDSLTLTIRRQTLSTTAQAEQEAELRTIITEKHPNIVKFNLANLRDETHYHWSNARDDLERGTQGIPLLRTKSAAPCVCSDF